MGNRMTHQMEIFGFFSDELLFGRTCTVLDRAMNHSKDLKVRRVCLNCVQEALCLHRRTQLYGCFSCPAICHRKLFFHINSVYWNYLVNHLFFNVMGERDRFPYSGKSWNSRKTEELFQTEEAWKTVTTAMLTSDPLI